MLGGYLVCTVNAVFAIAVTKAGGIWPCSVGLREEVAFIGGASMIIHVDAADRVGPCRQNVTGATSQNRFGVSKVEGNPASLRHRFFFSACDESVAGSVNRGFHMPI